MSDVSDKVAQLVDMGFQPEQAMEALSAAQMNVEGAIAILFGEELTQQPPLSSPATHQETDTVKILNPGEIPVFSPYNTIENEKSDFDGTLGEPTPDSSSSNEDIDLENGHPPGLIDPLQEEVDMIANDGDISSSDEDCVHEGPVKDGLVEFDTRESISGVNKRTRHVNSIFDRLNHESTKNAKLLIPIESDTRLNYIGPFLIILLQIPRFQSILFDLLLQFKDYGWSEKWAADGKISPMVPTELVMQQFEPFKFLIELQRIGAWFMLPEDLVHRSHVSTQSLIRSFPKTLGIQVNETNLIEEIVPKIYEGISIGILGVSSSNESSKIKQCLENNEEEMEKIEIEENDNTLNRNTNNEIENQKNLNLASKDVPTTTFDQSHNSIAIDELMKSVVYSKEDEQSNNVHHIDIELSSSHTSLYDAFNELIWGNDLEQLGQIYFTKLGQTLTITNVCEDFGPRNLDFEISEIFYPGLYSESFVDRLVEMNSEKSSQYRQRLELVKKLNQFNFFEGKRLGNILEKTASVLEGEAKEDMMAFNANLDSERRQINEQLLHISKSFEENNILNGPALIEKLKSQGETSGLDPYIIVGIVLSAQQYCYRDLAADKWICIKYVENSFRGIVEDVIRQEYDTFDEVKANINQSSTLTMVFIKLEMWQARKQSFDVNMIPHALKRFFERDNSSLKKQEEFDKNDNATSDIDVKHIDDAPAEQGQQLDRNQEDSYVENVGTELQPVDVQKVT